MKLKLAVKKERPAPEKIDVEAESKKELTEMQTKFKADAAREAKSMQDNNDSAYWCCLIFQTRAQKEEFLRNAGLIDLGDQYLDGIEVAQKLKIPIKTEALKMPKNRINKRWMGSII